MKAIIHILFLVILFLLIFCPVIAGNYEMEKTTLTHPQPILGVIPLGDNERLIGGTCDSNNTAVSIALESGEELETTCLNGTWEASLPEGISGIVDILIDDHKMVLVSPVLNGMTPIFRVSRVERPDGIVRLHSTVPDIATRSIAIILISWNRAVILKHNIIEAGEEVLLEIDTSSLPNGEYVLFLRSGAGGKQVYSEPLIIKVEGRNAPQDTVLDRIKIYYNEKCKGLKIGESLEKLAKQLNTEYSVVSVHLDKDNISWTTSDGRLWVFYVNSYTD